MNSDMRTRAPKLGALWTACILCLSPFAAEAASSLEEVANSLNIDRAQVSVSGISSGGFMAHQFHVAHSANIIGAGIVAGGPFGCAEGSIVNAVTKCSKFMALQCNAPMTGLGASFAPFCANPFSGPTTDEEAVATAQRSFSLATAAETNGRIDALSGLSRARIYLFTGTNDEIVPYEIMNAVFHFYADADKASVNPANIELNRLFRARHTMVTDNFYSATRDYVGVCNVQRTLFGDPYIGDCREEALAMRSANSCDCTEGAGSVCPTSVEAQQACSIVAGRENSFPKVWPEQSACEQNVRREACDDADDVDLAGAILQKIYPDVVQGGRESLLSAQEVRNVQGAATRLSQALAKKMVTFSQAKLIEQRFGAKDAGAWASFADNGYLYIPDDCKAGAPCRLHVAFHGCKQGGDNDHPFGNIFSRFAGYNEWAKNNHMVVMYPQVQAENFAPMNPQGCWDWWGLLYTGPDDYNTQNGKQVKAVAQMVNILVHEPLLPVPGAEIRSEQHPQQAAR